jgi:hypothetical protein
MVSEFLSGFTPSATEIILVGVLLLALIVGLVIYSTVRRRRERRRVERSAEQTFQVLVRRHNLTEDEQELLRDVARHLERPEKKHMLLKNQAVFDNAARGALEAGDVPQSSISSLRVKLGYSGMHAGEAPESSVEIPEDAAVMLAFTERSGEKHTVRGRVSRHIPSAFCVRMDKEATLPQPGTHVSVIYFNATGVYRFSSDVTEISDGEIYLSHSEELSRMQRREFHRREVHLPVYVKSSTPRETGDTAASTKAELIEVGGGGARVYSPDTSFKEGSEVELTFHPDSNNALHVAGSVIKRSRRGTVLHISFDRIRERTRDRLFKTILGRR